MVINEDIIKALDELGGIDWGHKFLLMMMKLKYVALLWYEV